MNLECDTSPCIFVSVSSTAQVYALFGRFANFVSRSSEDRRWGAPVPCMSVMRRHADLQSQMDCSACLLLPHTYASHIRASSRALGAWSWYRESGRGMGHARTSGVTGNCVWRPCGAAAGAFVRAAVARHLRGAVRGHGGLEVRHVHMQVPPPLLPQISPSPL